MGLVHPSHAQPTPLVQVLYLEIHESPHALPFVQTLQQEYDIFGVETLESAELDEPSSVDGSKVDAVADSLLRSNPKEFVPGK